jgi:DNA-binding NtrC family response regulator
MKMRKQMEALIEEMLDGQILLGEAISEFEKLYIEKCLERNKKHISKSADVLGIHRNTLSKRIASYNKKPMKSMAKRR